MVTVIDSDALQHMRKATLVKAFGYLVRPRKFSFDDQPDEKINNGTLHFITASGIEVSGTVWDPRVTRHELSAGHKQSMDQLYEVAKTITAEMNEAFDTADYAYPEDRIFTVSDSINDMSSNKDISLTLQQAYDTGRSIGGGAEKAFLKTIELETSLSPKQSLAAHAQQLPDGRSYIPRKILGIRDTNFLAQARTQAMSVMLSSEPGTGKTTMVQATFGDELTTINCFEQMITADLVGQWKPVPGRSGEFEWADGPLITAMEQGQPLLLDDATWMPDAVQALLLPVTDHRRTLTVADRPENTTITAATGFMVIFAANPGTGFGIIEPLRNRIAANINVPMDLHVAEQLNIDPRLLTITKELMQQKRLDKISARTHWIPPLRTLLKATHLANTFDITVAAAALQSEAPNDDDLQERLKRTIRDALGRDVPPVLEALA